MKIRSAISAGILTATAAAAIGVSAATGASATPPPAIPVGSLCITPDGSLCLQPAPAEATITTVVTNNTDATMYFTGGHAPDGHWVDGPSHTIAPHTSQTVRVASDAGPGVGVYLDYHLSAWWGNVGDVTIAVNNYHAQTNTDGSAASPGVRLDPHFVHGSPDARYIFTVS
ncbi:hypothetical protein [Tomitella cavernea]|uniref:Uncharacterized protein n=1 Tax=Tomitella cavernea TaxID=1387982 RepID=A0ABP9D2K7_9ACTN|nr:hypothetical protein [Tomitella cavernea]